MWDVNRGTIVPAGGTRLNAGADQQIWVGNWNGVRGFEALPKHQFMTESTNINSLADHYIWSTIKTLPATLPEPSSMDRGPRTRVTGTVSLSDLYVCKGVGVYIGCRLLRVGPWFWDWRSE